ncbi:FadR/GntR family transcriptional regulator [Candidimonas nitroreducens]|uniref:GntR family transcriptional regulator n=1 Tax=Candidimonas nitroreducens TaxID=683354 RepID=A0A225M944_9BURK|nr:FadR/GntR family transcriptional regulator [Candidimonas nitroreducens]OWT57636.1 GntR family transcriptional regulator [Candidimonas nitroreducens]
MQISRPTLTSRVADTLIQRIGKGTYPVGSKLPSGRLLAQEFSVSAAVIREATESLRAKGLIESRQGSGCVVLAAVADPGFQLALPADAGKLALRHIYELRCEIESGAACLAAQHATAAEVAAMEAILARLEKNLQAPGRALQWDLAFHKAIAKATHNPQYAQLLQYLNEQWRGSVQAARRHTAAIDRVHDHDHGQTAASAAMPNSLARQVHKEHVAILAAIRRRDPPAARAAARTHMLKASRRLGLDASEH